MASKFLFNLKKTAIYQALKWAEFPLFKFNRLLKGFLFFLFLITFFIFLYGFITQAINYQNQKNFLGLTILSAVFYSITRLANAFFNAKLKNPVLDFTITDALANLEKYNLAECLSFESAQIIKKAINFCRQKNFSTVNSTVLFYFLLFNKKLQFIFRRALLDNREIARFLLEYFKTIPVSETKQKLEYSLDFQETIKEALNSAKKRNNLRIELEDLLLALAKVDLIFKKVLSDHQLKFTDIENLVNWLNYLENRINKQKIFWDWSNLVKKGSIGRDWIAGYTPTLDRFSFNISALVKEKNFPEVIGHQEEIKTMERILARSEINNVLIVGEPGSGRRSMIHALAEKSFLGESLPELNYKKIVQLDLTNLLARFTSLEEVESILNEIFQEVLDAGNVILVVDEFHNFVGGGIRPGVIDISGLLVPYLASPAFPIIAITSFEGLHKYIEPNSSLLSLFEKVEVKEVSEEETLKLLQNLSLVLERKNKKLISYPALKQIITYCAKYLPAIPFPEKALDLLDEAMVYLVQTKDKILLPQHIAKIVTEKTEIPVGEIEEKERQILLHLEDLIHQRIINQEEAVKEVATAMQRARTQITIRKGPIGAFLFLGPTGVGKTETSKALAEIYFGSEEKMIRLDMSEFQNVSDIPRLIGSTEQPGFLTTQVREQPFSLILLDEVEKAHPNILNLFLQVLDEGHLTDGLGRKVDFKNTIIIATSNAGYQIILKALAENKNWDNLKKEILDYLFQEGIFRPEFINRFDAVVVFRPLTPDNLLMIAELLLTKLKKNLKEKEIDLVITESLKKKIVELGYDPVFGARQMRRVIQDKIENIIAQAILSGLIKKGMSIEIEPENFQLKIK